MDWQQIGAIGGVVAPAIAFAVWLVRIEGRVNGHDRELGDVKEDVRYIRDRIDRALNGKHD